MLANTNRRVRQNSKHEPNSAAAYFVFTFDNSRSQYYKFEGRDCMQNVLEQLRLLATRCVEEQQENTKWRRQQKIKQITERQQPVIFAKGLLQNQIIR